MLKQKDKEDIVLSREEVLQKRKIICEKLYILQSDYGEKDESEQEALDIEIRKYGKKLERLVLPRRTATSLYKRNYKS